MATKKETNKKEVKKVKNVTVNYPVGDFLIRVKNAATGGRKELTVPVTKMVKSVADVLKTTGFVSEVKVVDGVLQLTLARFAKEPVLLGLTVISRPGLRQYINVDELREKKGPEIYILSTPKGVMSSKEAIKKSVGGELIAKIW